MLSVVIPTIGRNSLETVLLSISTQLIEKITIILIDDSKTGLSKDRILNISGIENLELIYLRTSGMLGPSKARNLGLQNIKTKWVAFADDDDPWTENRLLEQLFLMKELRLNASVLLDQKNAVHKIVWEGEKSPLFFLYEKSGLLRGSRYIPFGTLIYEYEIYKNVRFNHDLNEREDLWFLHELFSCNSMMRQLPIIGCRVTKNKLRSIRRPSSVDDICWYQHLTLLDKKLATNFLIYVSIRNSLATLNLGKIYTTLNSLRKIHQGKLS
jgi:glycosyltransferase involved in cell wall biosynthesis